VHAYADSWIMNIRNTRDINYKDQMTRLPYSIAIPIRQCKNKMFNPGFTFKYHSLFTGIPKLDEFLKQICVDCNYTVYLGYKFLKYMVLSLHSLWFKHSYNLCLFGRKTDLAGKEDDTAPRDGYEGTLMTPEEGRNEGKRVAGNAAQQVRRKQSVCDALNELRDLEKAPALRSGCRP
jgi:hypothetical protein